MTEALANLIASPWRFVQMAALLRATKVTSPPHRLEKAGTAKTLVYHAMVL